MKRFYCTVCQKVRRARSLPLQIQSSDVVSERKGVCNWHYSFGSRINKPLKTRTHSSKSLPTPQQVSHKTIRKTAGVR